jgi:hypothetical protein
VRDAEFVERVPHLGEDLLVRIADAEYTAGVASFRVENSGEESTVPLGRFLAAPGNDLAHPVDRGLARSADRTHSTPRRARGRELEVLCRHAGERKEQPRACERFPIG